MLKLFSAGLIASLIYVITGVAKQYLIAAQLPVVDVGAYGAWVARASLLLVLVPFPAYLELLIKGFAPSVDERLNHSRLVVAVRRELAFLRLIAIIILVGVLVHSVLVQKLNSSLIALLLLLFAQYINSTADVMLRMIQAHRRFAVFMAMRNLPSLVLIGGLGVDSALTVVFVDLISALLIWWFVYQSGPLRESRLAALQSFRPTLLKEQRTLWLARLLQYANSALLRLAVPFVFGAHETGLFFFACIAQTPCALFLSVANQLFGHALARLQRGDSKQYLGILQWFVLPNVLYATAVAALVPYWNSLIVYVDSLAKYQDVGPLVLATVLYSAVLASDCQEFLLRSRGLSIVLLRYNMCSISSQCVCLVAAFYLQFSLAQTIVFCAVVACLILVAFSLYSFFLVISAPQRG